VSQRIELANGGYVIFGDGLNDITVVSTILDPVNVKFAAPADGGVVGMGAVSWGILRPDGQVEQKVLFQGKVDERTRFTPDLKERGGEFTIHVHDGQKHYVNGEIRDDASMRLVLMARHDIVWVNQLVTSAEYPGGLPGWNGPVPASTGPYSPPPVPAPVPPSPTGPSPVPPSNSYHGFAYGDTTALAKAYPIDLVDDVNDWRNGKWGTNWPAFVDYVERRAK